MNNTSDESLRRGLVEQNSAAVESNNPMAEAKRLKAIHGVNNVWGSKEFQKKFEVRGFTAPFCGVVRRTDRAKGIVEFQHWPRFYFNFQQK